MQKDQTEQLFWDEKELSSAMRMSLAWLRKSRMAGTGPPFFRFGSAIRYRVTDAQEWINSCPSGGAGHRVQSR